MSSQIPNGFLATPYAGGERQAAFNAPTVLVWRQFGCLIAAETVLGLPVPSGTEVRSMRCERWHGDCFIPAMDLATEDGPRIPK